LNATAISAPPAVIEAIHEKNSMMGQNFYWLLSITLWSWLIASESSSTSIKPTVTIESGIVIGVPTTLPRAASRVNKFLGIPYSAPVKRWDLPKKVSAWRKPLNASTMGPICTQAWNFNGKTPAATLVAESLTLSFTKPWAPILAS